jgi:hypothetical protein
MTVCLNCGRSQTTLPRWAVARYPRPVTFRFALYCAAIAAFTGDGLEAGCELKKPRSSGAI